MRPRRSLLAAALVCLLAALFGEPVADELDLADLVGSLTAVVAGAHLAAITGSLRPAWLPVLVALAGAHYLAAALAVRAAGGLKGRLGQTGLAQLAAAAANRLTPLGLGAAAVNVRYLVRRGVGTPDAVGALAALGVLGALADLLVTVGVWLVDQGGAGSGSATNLLGRRIAHAAHGLSATQLLRLLGLVLVVGLLGGGWRRYRQGGAPAPSRRLMSSARQAAAAALSLRRRPAALGMLMLCSGATTAILGVAFLVSLSAVAGGRTQASATALLLLFLVSSAAASSVPSPAGIGTTEGALVAVLLLAHDTTSHAVAAVLLFRLVTFWAPVPLGLLAAHALRRRGVL